MASAAAVLSVPMYFRISRDKLQQPDIDMKLNELGKLCLGSSCQDNPTEVSLGTTGNKLLIFHNQQNCHVIAGVYEKGSLITVDIQHFDDTDDVKQQKYNLSFLRSLEQKLADHFQGLCESHNSLHCPIRRGQRVWPYAVSADDRLLEIDHESLIFETTSRWQNIRIFRRRHGGNALVLDGDAMLGEDDQIYTATLCRIGHEDYSNKTVLVLGGGDGGVLHEILKEKPSFVTVAEIDEEVVKACRVHLRGACGDSLDKMEGPNYKIVIDNCMNVLQDSVKQAIRYDFVINDLTEFPVDKTVNGYDYDFVTTSAITELSLKVLKPGGKLFARGNCIGAVEYRNRFESDVTKLGYHFIRRDVYVPSFHEIYCLYEIYSPVDLKD